MNKLSGHYNIHKKKLVYIPIIHDQADMGALRESVQQASIHKFGEKAWMKKLAFIDQSWADIEHAIEAMPLSYEKIRIYQDGLPVCGYEADIVSQMSTNGSRNYQLIEKLIKGGAMIMGTEAPELLIHEYELMMKMNVHHDDKTAIRSKARLKIMSESLIKKRDSFIAHRIHDTLGEGETGMLFIGALHSVEKFLSKDIQIIYPLNRLFNQRSVE